MLKLIAVLCFVITIYPVSIKAQENTISVENIGTEQSWRDELSKFTLEAVVASEQVKSSDTHEVNGLYSSFKTSLLYALSSTDELRIYTSFVKEDYEKNQGRDYFELGEVMYRRKSILNEADHGINLNFEFKHAVVLDTETRRYWGFTTETIPQIIVKKSLPNATGVELKARHHIYARNRINASAPTNEDRLYLSGYKMFANSFLFNTELKYRHKIYTGKHYSHQYGGIRNKGHEDLVIHPGLMYFATRQSMIEGYVETKLNDTFDHRKVSQLMRDELIFGAALYVTLF